MNPCVGEAKLSNWVSRNHGDSYARETRAAERNTNLNKTDSNMHDSGRKENF